MNSNFEAAAKAVKSLMGKTGSLWDNLARFAASIDPSEPPKDAFKAQEKEATVTMKVEMGKNSTYRVQKGILIGCITKGIPIVDASGKPRGKTELEEELKALKVSKSPADKFKIALNTASNIADSLTDGECLTAAALVNDLMNKVSVRIPKAA